MGLSIGGLGSGLDTASIVASLMQVERIPQDKVYAAQGLAQKRVSAWSELRTKTATLQGLAEALRTADKAVGVTATSSDAAVKATAAPGAPGGQHTVTVKQMATAATQTWPAQTVPPSGTGLGPVGMTVGAGTTAVSSGPGTTRATVDLSGAESGIHVMTVTRPSTAATAWTTPKLALGATDLTVQVGDDPAFTFDLEASYDSPEAFRDDLKDKLSGVLDVDLVAGRLQLRVPYQGSTSTLMLSGGAATELGLPETAHGQSALLTVDGKRQEVDPPSSGTDLVEVGETGIRLGVSAAGLEAGTIRTNVVRTSSSSTLLDLQTALNGSGSPVSASLVPEADGTARLVLTSTTTGDDVDDRNQAQRPLVLTSDLVPLSGSSTWQAGKDAQVEVDGQTVTRGSNTLKDVLPGVTLDLLHAPKDPVTVGVSRDTSGTKDKVSALVDGMNTLISSVRAQTKSEPGGTSNGALAGSSTARQLSATLFSKASSVVPAGDLRTLSQVGIQTTRSGDFTFDAATLQAALDKDPDAVATVLAGFADAVAGWTKDTAKTGGLLTSARDGAQAEVDARQKQYDDYTERLTRTEARYKAQYAALETAMASLKSQQSAMSAALSGLTTG